MTGFSRACALLVAVAVALGLRAEIAVSDGPAAPGEWNSDFAATLAAARKAHRPMLLVHVSRGCPVCVRLNKMLDGEAFHRWQKDRNLFMVYRSSGSESNLREQTRDFIISTTGGNPGFPYVCAYWEKEDGSTNCVAFAGRRGEICKDEKFALFSVEFMTAVDRALAEYLAKSAPHDSIAQILSNSVKRIAFDKSGTAKGGVSMNPPTGILPEGGKVSLYAKPAADELFVGWRHSGAGFVGWNTKLEVSGSMPAGTYTAQFRPKADCPPPVLTGTSTSLCARVGWRMEHDIAVDDKCRPVHFRPVRRLPKWLKLDKVSGRLSGTPKQEGTERFSIAVSGFDAARTVKTYAIEVKVQPALKEK